MPELVPANLTPAETVAYVAAVQSAHHHKMSRIAMGLDPNKEVPYQHQEYPKHVTDADGNTFEVASAEEAALYVPKAAVVAEAPKEAEANG